MAASVTVTPLMTGDTNASGADGTANTAKTAASAATMRNSHPADGS